MTSAVALLSGGLDSGTGLAMWLAAADRTVSLCITFDYGQRSALPEQDAARALAGRFDLPHQTVPLPWLAEAALLSGSTLVDGGGELPRSAGPERPGDEASAAAVWVPARNVVFLAAAASFAEATGDGVVLTGFNREEAATFPDNSEAFVSAFDRVLQLGTRNGVTVFSPTLSMDKIEIVAEARRHGLAETDFWSCYAAGPEPCGTCESCVRSRRAWG